MATIDDVVAAVSKETTDTGSLVALTTTLKAALVDALSKVGQLTPAQQAAIDSVFDSVNSNDKAVADALAANVP
jgi:hypothetical protein